MHICIRCSSICPDDQLHSYIGLLYTRRTAIFHLIHSTSDYEQWKLNSAKWFIKMSQYVRNFFKSWPQFSRVSESLAPHVPYQNTTELPLAVIGLTSRKSRWSQVGNLWFCKSYFAIWEFKGITAATGKLGIIFSKSCLNPSINCKHRNVHGFYECPSA